MPKLTVFNQVSLDGYFTDVHGEIGWVGKAGQSEDLRAFVAENSRTRGPLIFGRVTYQMMESFWPTPFAKEQMPEVAAGMNERPKLVFSRSLTQVTWANTTLVKGDLVGEVKRLKAQAGDDLTILGSGQIVAQLARENLIDEYQLMVVPVALGQGRTLFEGLDVPRELNWLRSRSFDNGNVLLSYRK